MNMKFMIRQRNGKANDFGNDNKNSLVHADVIKHDPSDNIRWRILVLCEMTTTTAKRTKSNERVILKAFVSFWKTISTVLTLIQLGRSDHDWRFLFVLMPKTTIDNKRHDDKMNELKSL